MTSPTPSGPAVAPGAPPTPATPPEPSAPSATPPTGWTWDGKVESLPADVQRHIKDLRQEAARRRTEPKALLAELASAIGADVDDQLTPAQLAERVAQGQADISAARQAAAAAEIELGVFRAATRLGADAERLMDSRSFVDSLDAIEYVDDSQYFAEVEKRIRARLDEEPSLRLGASATSAQSRVSGVRPDPSQGARSGGAPTATDGAALYRSRHKRSA